MGIARINMASWFALFVGITSVFLIRFGVGHGGSIFYAIAPALLTLPMFAWAMVGHWDCPKRLPLLLAGVGICGTFLAAVTALASANDGDAIPVMLGTCMCISSRILTGFMIQSPMLHSDIDRLD
jgi:hypothetical protein